jgi:hypothetical protein
VTANPGHDDNRIHLTRDAKETNASEIITDLPE